MKATNDPIERIRKLEDLIAKKRALLIREKGKLSEKEKRARLRRLIEIGELTEIAGLSEPDLGFLLGLLLRANSITPQSAKWRVLKAKGDSLLKELQAKKKKEANNG